MFVEDRWGWIARESRGRTRDRPESNASKRPNSFANDGWRSIFLGRVCKFHSGDLAASFGAGRRCSSRSYCSNSIAPRALAHPKIPRDLTESNFTTKPWLFAPIPSVLHASSYSMRRFCFCFY